MNLPTDFSSYVRYSGIATLVLLGLTLLAFVLKWGIRFRLVGITGFLTVLTIGIFGLGLGWSTKDRIPGAAKFARVYDNGGTQVVIAVSPEITQTELDATLRQAASNLFSYGRVSSAGETQLLIRARTLLHPEAGVTIPVYLGQAKYPLGRKDDRNLTIEIFQDKFAQLPKKTAV